MSRSVTLNLGVRYELPLPFVDRHDAMNAFRPGQQSTRFPDAPTGLVYPGDAGIPRGTYATDRNNVAPRVSGVWDVTGTGRSVVRAAWGLFYDALAGQFDVLIPHHAGWGKSERAEWMRSPRDIAAMSMTQLDALTSSAIAAWVWRSSLSARTTVASQARRGVMPWRTSWPA